MPTTPRALSRDEAQEAPDGSIVCVHEHLSACPQ
jgi:hypothetical protein